MKQAIIIGGGFSGLATACYLAREGLRVRVFEKNQSIGGRARLLEIDGYRFDIGPSWYMMPEIFESFFADFGKNVNDYYQMTPLNPSYKIFWEDKSSTQIYSDLQKNKSFFDSEEQNGMTKLESYLLESKKIYQLVTDKLLKKEYKSILSAIDKDILSNIKTLHLMQSYDGFVGNFFQSKKIKQILEYTTLFLGVSPFESPAVYSMLSYADFGKGISYPMGGIWQVSVALKKLARELGVEILENSEVDSILIDSDKAKAVQVNEEKYFADVIVSSADLHHTEMNLLDNKHVSYGKKFWKKAKIAPSMFLMYLGVSKKIKNLTHHNLYFQNDWGIHFDQLFGKDKKDLPLNPCLYICVPSKTDSSVAPKGKENIFVLVPIKAGDPLSVDDKNMYKNHIIKHIQKIIGEDFQKEIEVCQIYERGDFQKDYHAFLGTALGLSHTFMQSAFFRPTTKSKKVKNLYYTGQYVQPGIGMPMALISAKLVANRILHDLEKLE